MIIKINFEDFVDKFKFMGRENQFSYKGLRALYDYLTELEQDINKPIELDVIALCCDYTEYNINDYLNDNYTTEEINEKLENLNQEEFNKLILEEIEEKTTLIKINDNSFIIKNH
jgi:hypothetical protein